MTESMQNALNDLWLIESDPEAVCYIEKHNGEGFKIEEIEGDYCHGCATRKAKRLDTECDGTVYHQVYEETSPENDHFTYCHECGCLLNASLIVCIYNEIDFDNIVCELKRVKTFEDIDGDLAWKIGTVFSDEETARSLFPKKMIYITRRITNLYRKWDKRNDYYGKHEANH